MKLKLNLNYCLLALLIVILLYCCLGKNFYEGLATPGPVKDKNSCGKGTLWDEVTKNCLPMSDYCGKGTTWNKDQHMCVLDNSNNNSGHPTDDNFNYHNNYFGNNQSQGQPPSGQPVPPGQPPSGQPVPPGQPPSGQPVPPGQPPSGQPVPPGQPPSSQLSNCITACTKKAPQHAGECSTICNEFFGGAPGQPPSGQPVPPGQPPSGQPVPPGQPPSAQPIPPGQPPSAPGQPSYSQQPQQSLPPGQNNHYMLNSNVSSSVAPSCPAINSGGGGSCCKKEKPCPPCARCPEPAFKCKKVPDYNSTNISYLPKPLLNDFSQF